MNLSRFVTTTICAASVFLTVAGNASATQSSEFTSCLTPTGEIIANYNDGEHGIPNVGSKIGKDTVYSLANGNFMQCFCGSDGKGIQTNWMSVGELSENQISVYENEGWIFIPDGSAWGLTNGAYLAKNTNYTCGGSSTINSGGGDGKTDGRTDGRSDGLGSIVQSAKGTSLASTGNILFIAEIFGFGIAMTLTGVYMRRRSR